MGCCEESEVYVLAAGKQERYESNKSKLMVDINGKPAFDYLMGTIFSVFPSENTTIITSPNSTIFNEFIRDVYTRSHIKIDESPGRGTAHSLVCTLPWNSKTVFVTEADIFYYPQLIDDQIKKKEINVNTNVVMSVTPKVDVATSHRSVKLFPTLVIEEKYVKLNNVEYRNVGAYLLDAKAQRYLTGKIAELIGVIKYMHSIGDQIATNIYLAAYLHMARMADVRNWEEHFRDYKKDDKCT